MLRPPRSSLSPYLRSALVRSSLRVAGRGNERLVVDNCISGRTHGLSAVEQRVLRALWPPALDAESQLAQLRAEVGDAVLEAALSDLTRAQLIFASPEACEAAFVEAVSRHVPDVPLVDQVELTTHCPMRCGFCPRGIEGRLRRPRAHMSFELFERLLAQLSPHQATYRPLELNLLGESLVHPELARFVAAATARGLPTELSVNPSLLSPKLAASLLGAGLSRLVISLDAMDEPTLKAIRGAPASYAAAERNLEALFELARARPTPPAIVIQMIALERNVAQREAFLTRWDNTGNPFVQAYVKPLDGPDPDTGRASAHPTRYLCTFPFVSVSVLCDGSVVPCCRDAQGDYVLGNLNETSLAEIWHGDRVKRLRDAYLRDDVDDHPLCGQCSFNRKSFRESIAERAPQYAVVEPMHG